jgi:hypothetical protein
LDHFNVTTVGSIDKAGEFFPEIRSRLRFGEAGQFPLDFALAGEWSRVYGHDTYAGGPVLAVEIYENSLAANIFASSDENIDLRLGWRSPYITYTLKAGLEWRRLGESKASGLGPQLIFDAPGDLSLTLGGWFPLKPEGAPFSLRVRLDFTLFPHP